MSPSNPKPTHPANAVNFQIELPLCMGFPSPETGAGFQPARDQRQVEHLPHNQQQPPLWLVDFAIRESQPPSAVVGLHIRWAKTGEDEFRGIQVHSCRVATKANLRLAIVAVPAIVDLSVVKSNASTEICELARSISSLA